MKQLNNWEETLEYVNRRGIVNPTMPIGWKQQVLMDNVTAIEKESSYPLNIIYKRITDTFLIIESKTGNKYIIFATHN